MRQILALAFLLSTGALIPFVFAENSPPRASYRIGAILPLSGSMAFAGNEVRDAIDLARSEVGNTHWSYDFIIEDNGAGPTQTVAAARKLIDQDHIDALLTLWPEAANLAAPITEKREILHYTIAWDPSIACSHHLILSHQVMVGDYARATLEMLQQKSIKRLSFFHDSVFQQGATVLKELAPKYGVTFEQLFSFDRGASDFRSELAKTKKSISDGILIWSIMPETETFLRQLKNLKIDKFVSGFFDVVQDLSLIEGRSYPSEVYSTDDFQEKFKKQYGYTSSMKGPNAYDIIKLIVLAVEQNPSEKPTAKEVKQKLLKVANFAGAVGLVSIDRCGNSAYPIMIKTVENGKLRIVETSGQNKSEHHSRLR